MSNIGIVGAGHIGQAFARALARNGIAATWPTVAARSR
jgi:predicted dinucleotide-binding enzyme